MQINNYVTLHKHWWFRFKQTLQLNMTWVIKAQLLSFHVCQLYLCYLDLREHVKSKIFSSKTLARNIWVLELSCFFSKWHMATRGNNYSLNINYLLLFNWSHFLTTTVWPKHIVRSLDSTLACSHPRHLKREKTDVISNQIDMDSWVLTHKIFLSTSESQHSLLVTSVN